ncbi:MAG TPA: hypothetical protein DD412_04745 [Holosporales bacterium]|nr:hypothetical protein [Holosporales bacterium]
MRKAEEKKEKNVQKNFFYEKKSERFIFATKESDFLNGKKLAYKTPSYPKGVFFLRQYFYFEAALRVDVVSRVAR